MATHIPQRDLRNHPADVLQRVERGEELTITVRGRPVADLVPTREWHQKPTSYEDFITNFVGVLPADDQLLEEIKAEDDVMEVPFDR